MGGSSEGQFKDVKDMDMLVDDVLKFIDDLVILYPGLPIALRGQSMGGLLALSVALRRPALFVGLALGAPAYQLPWLVSKFAPELIISGGAHVREHIDMLRVPLAVFQGADDTTCDPAGARELWDAAGSADKTLHLYKDMGHNMSMEPDVLSWLLARVNGAPKEGSTLCIRKPIPGENWKPPPPGSTGADANTILEIVTDRDEQKIALGATIPDQVSAFRVVGGYLRMLPMAFRR